MSLHRRRKKRRHNRFHCRRQSSVPGAPQAHHKLRQPQRPGHGLRPLGSPAWKSSCLMAGGRKESNGHLAGKTQSVGFCLTPSVQLCKEVEKTVSARGVSSTKPRYTNRLLRHELQRSNQGRSHSGRGPRPQTHHPQTCRRSP